MKPHSTSYCPINFGGQFRCQARLALSWQDGSLSCTQWERPHDTAQSHDYLDIKTVDDKTDPENNLLHELCLLKALGVVLDGIMLSAPGSCQGKYVEGKGGKKKKKGR